MAESPNESTKLWGLTGLARAPRLFPIDDDGVTSAFPSKARWRLPGWAALVDRVVRGSPDLDPEDDRGEAEGAQARTRPLAYLGAVAVVVVCTGVSWLMFHRFDPRNLAMVYLVGVAFVATRIGRGPSAVAAFLSVVSLEFFFVPPYFAFAMDDAQYMFTLAVMLLVALLISTLASRFREQAEEARRRERRTQILYSMTRELAALSDPREIARAAARHLTDVFGLSATVLPAEGEGSAEPYWEALADPRARSAARGTFETGLRAGSGTDIAPDSPFVCLPLVGSRLVGVVALGPRVGAILAESLTLLELLARQIAVSIERAQLAAQAESTRVDMERERLRNALLSSVSHDLRTPLAAITGAATSLLHGNALSAEARQEMNAMIYEESERLNRLVGNLLDMTRVQSGDLRVAREWQSIEEVVGSAVRRLRKLLQDHPVQADLPRDLPLVPMDAVLIEQVFVNLLENAAKYTPSGSMILVGAKAEAGSLTVEVADAGPGLPLGAHPGIFEKFSAGSQGVGLGLAICRAIVTAHGGQISAENGATGGAVFRFSLPLEVAGLPPLPDRAR
jgi:two-component system, OmpR family, sensor histidine kinase KdpD